MPISWTEKYRPKNLEDVVGHKKAITSLVRFINNFKSAKKKGLLLSGPPGNGKTSIVKSLANEEDFEIVELNASDLRNKKSINNFFGAASKQASLVSKSKILVAEEIDGLSGSDRGGVSALIKIIKETNFPVILTANDPYLKKLRNLRKYCNLVKMHKINYRSIQKRLRGICKNEDIEYDEVVLKKIALYSEGDLRAAINDLQTMAQGKDKINENDLNKWSRESEENIFNALKLIFKSFDTRVALDAVNDLNEDFNVLNYWLDENIHREYKQILSKRDSYKNLSRSDIFLGRIRRWQHLIFIVYSKFISVVGVQQAKEETSRSFNMYQRPKIMSWMFRRGIKRRKMRSDLRIAGEKMHASSSNLNKSFWPYYKFIKTHDKKVGKQIDEWLEIAQ